MVMIVFVQNSVDVLTWWKSVDALCEVKKTCTLFVVALLLFSLINDWYLSLSSSIQLGSFESFSASSAGVFGDDDDIFGVGSSSKPNPKPKQSSERVSSSDMLGNDDDDIFGGSLSSSAKNPVNCCSLIFRRTYC